MNAEHFVGGVAYYRRRIEWDNSGPGWLDGAAVVDIQIDPRLDGGVFVKFPESIDEWRQCGFENTDAYHYTHGGPGWRAACDVAWKLARELRLA